MNDVKLNRIVTIF